MREKLTILGIAKFDISFVNTDVNIYFARNGLEKSVLSTSPVTASVRCHGVLSIV